MTNTLSGMRCSICLEQMTAMISVGTIGGRIANCRIVLCNINLPGGMLVNGSSYVPGTYNGFKDESRNGRDEREIGDYNTPGFLLRGVYFSAVLPARLDHCHLSSASPNRPRRIRHDKGSVHLAYDCASSFTRRTAVRTITSPPPPSYRLVRFSMSYFTLFPSRFMTNLCCPNRSATP